MIGLLPSDTVKNPKLNTNPTLSARAYPTGDHQSSSNSFKLVNAIQTCFKSNTCDKKDQLQVNTLTVSENETPTLKEPKETLEDEFTDLHLNRPVLEVLAHVPMYDTLLDKYLELKVGLLEDTNDVLGLADGTKSYPVGIVRNVEVHVGKLKLFEDFHVWEIARDAEVNPFKDVLVFRKMVEFLVAIPINLKGNMWESEDLIENPIKWNRPPKEGDGVWRIRIELIDHDGEIFDREFQSIPTNMRLSLKENPSDILNFDHFHDS
ncbi:hypothetical protein Tco_1496180 [Tanacetum coccineum]